MWQIAAGRAGIDYRQVFLAHDVMLMGMGDGGDFRRLPERYPKGLEFTGQVRRFAQDPAPNDVVVMRFGQDAIGAGVIPEKDYDYQYLDQFADVYGWDLQHARRVTWNEQASEMLAALNPAFPAKGSQPTFTAIGEKRSKLRALENDLRKIMGKRALKPLPPTPQELDEDELGLRLFSHGLSNDAVEDVVKSIRKARRLSQWYSSKESGDSRPTEHELVGHILIPLMSGLGWSEQLMAVEWQKIDLAFFAGPPTTAENCSMICEAKADSSTFEAAYDQAKRYVITRKLSNCARILVSDGRRIYVFTKGGGGWPTKPDGYVNLLRMRPTNLLHEGIDTVKTLVDLTPAGVAQARLTAPS